MKRAFFATLFILALPPAQAQDETSSPPSIHETDDERAWNLHLQERARAAARLFAQARAEEARGAMARAEDCYRRILTHFPERHADQSAAELALRELRQGGRILKTILAQRSKAIGQPRLARLRSARLTGQLIIGEESLTFVRSMSFSPPRVREDAPERGLSKAWDGSKAWLERKGVVEVLRGPRLDRAAAWAEECCSELRAEIEGEPRFLGPVKVAGRKAWRIEWRKTSQSWIEDIDAETGLPLRAEGERIDDRGEARKIQLYYYDWKLTDGARIPAQIEAWRGDERIYEFRYEVINLDPELPDGIFQPGS